jgi:glycosyltransferase involved in cell wall biosynthesis
MRIAMIGAKGIPVETGMGGGIERVVEVLSTRLAERGHHVTVYVRPYANPKKRKSWNGVRLITLPCIRRRYIETISHVFRSTLHALVQDYDIIHFHGVGPSVMAWIPRLFAPRMKVVVTFHARDRFHELRHPIARGMLAVGEWTAVHVPHATIAVSHVIQEFCRLRFHKQVQYIPNAVELPPNHPVPSDRLLAMGLKPGRYLLGIGRLVQFKAFDVAIRAYRDVLTSMPLAIAGGAGYDKWYARQLVREAGKDQRVSLLGFKAGEDLRQLIAHAYAIVHPSRIEGMSLAVLEAMSYGKLVIMSNIPENREIADHSAICVKVDDEAAFYDVIQWAVSDPGMVAKRGARARQFVAANYSWAPVVRETEALYQHLLRG